jgi:hypothetical protein
LAKTQVRPRPRQDERPPVSPNDSAQDGQLASGRSQVKKYDWDIDPDDADHPTIHGLRGTGILARAEQGYELDQIANDIGMSRQNVEHYMRFRDQMKVGAEGQKRLRLVNNED